MDDYANAFHLAAPWWAAHGITTYAYDQRGFGRSPRRGVWGGADLMVEDLRTACALVRRRHPRAILAVAGESMGGAVAIAAFASQAPPVADRLLLFSPAVWGWSTQPLPYSDPLMLWGSRFDTLYGLVSLMETAWRRIGAVRVPTAYFYGAHDQIIPKRAAISAADRLRAPGRTLYYAQGWHLLLRDLQAETVWRDAMAFIRDPAAAPPSGAPPMPKTAPKDPPGPDLPPGVRLRRR
jgi:alpha-beta hydrolase superfamily lysophospholipase